MATPDASQLIVWLLFFIYALLSIILYFWHHVYDLEVRSASHKPPSYHGRLSLIGLILCGAGMCIYRLFRGFRTRIIKYVHVGVQTVALIFFIFGVIYVPERGNGETVIYYNITDPVHITCDVHIVVGYMIFVVMILQFIFAIIVFVVLFDEGRKRIFIAPFHEIVGIWILISLVIAYLSGVYYMYATELGYHDIQKNSIRDMMNEITIPAYISFLIVLIIVLTPYFEWDLVGPL